MSRHQRPREVFYGKSQDTLCCCEYLDRTGKTNHVLACCCDCEALDSTCDRLITCKSLNNTTVGEMFKTIEDRLRIPSCTGKGAIKVNLDVAIPALIVPTGILIGTLHPALTILMLVFMPLSMMTSYRLWLGMKTKPRTRMFFVFGLVSYFQMYLTFELIVCNMWEVMLWENILCSSFFFLTLYALYIVKKNPGVIKNRPGNTASHDMMTNFQKLHNGSTTQNTHNHSHHHGNQCCDSNSSQTASSASLLMEKSSMNSIEEDTSTELSTKVSIDIVDEEAKEEEENIMNFGAVGAALIKNFAFDKSVIQSSVEEKRREMEKFNYITPKQLVTHVDSRITTEGGIFTWCEQCDQEKPPRAGHCNVCNACIHVRDHHCVWVDSCIGGQNHRAFVLAILFFVVGGAYGINLSLTTICTPTALWRIYFLYPTDCRYIYNEFPTALVFVSCVYASLAILGMTSVLLQTLILISSNITSEEMYKASIRGWTRRLGLKPINHVLDRGFLRNWWDFWSGGRTGAQSYDKAGSSSNKVSHSCDCGC